MINVFHYKKERKINVMQTQENEIKKQGFEPSQIHHIDI